MQIQQHNQLAAMVKKSFCRYLNNRFSQVDKFYLLIKTKKHMMHKNTQKALQYDQ